MGHTYDIAGAVSLDDLELVEGLCPPPLTCNFDDDSGNCHWVDYLPDGVRMTWSTGAGSMNITSAPPYVLTLVRHGEYPTTRAMEKQNTMRNSVYKIK